MKKEEIEQIKIGLRNNSSLSSIFGDNIFYIFPQVEPSGAFLTFQDLSQRKFPATQTLFEIIIYSSNTEKLATDVLGKMDILKNEIVGNNKIFGTVEVLNIFCENNPEQKLIDGRWIRREYFIFTFDCI